MTVVSYNTQSNYQAVTDNAANCAVGQQNCWQLSNAPAGGLVASGVRSGADGYTLAWDSSGNVYELSGHPIESWVLKSAMGQVSDLAIGSRNLIFALRTDTSFCGGLPYHRVFQWIWSTSSWVGWYGCLDSTYPGSLSAASDGTVLGVTGGGNQLWQIWQSSNHLISANGYKLPDVVSSSLAYIVKQDGSISTWDGTTVHDLWCGTGCGAMVSADPGDSTHPLVLQTPSGGGQVARWNGNGWSVLTQASLTSFSNGGSLNIWAIGPTLRYTNNGNGYSNLYHLSDIAVVSNSLLSGTVNCSQGCSVNHTAVVSSHYSTPNNKQLSGSNNAIFPATNSPNLSTSSQIFNVFDCFQSNTCQFILDQAQVTCPIFGQLYNFTNTLSFNSCFFYPRPANVGWARGVGWQQGITVTVYVDQALNSWSSTICNAMALWTVVNGVTYNCASGQSGPPPASNMSNYVWVFQAHGLIGGNGLAVTIRGGPWKHGPNGAHLVQSMIEVSDAISDSSTMQEVLAHEEGHDNFLGDCFLFCDSSLTGPTASVMHGVYPGATTPQPCDVYWYNTWYR